MLKLTKLNKKEMPFDEIYKYILKNEPAKNNLKDTFHDDNYDKKGNHIGREYKVIDKNDIINTFIINRKMIDDNADNDVFYLTHIYENPHQNIDLDDEEELF